MRKMIVCVLFLLVACASSSRRMAPAYQGQRLSDVTMDIYPLKADQIHLNNEKDLSAVFKEGPLKPQFSTFFYQAFESQLNAQASFKIIRFVKGPKELKSDFVLVLAGLETETRREYSFSNDASRASLVLTLNAVLIDRTRRQIVSRGKVQVMRPLVVGSGHKTWEEAVSALVKKWLKQTPFSLNQ